MGDRLESKEDQSLTIKAAASLQTSAEVIRNAECLLGFGDDGDLLLRRERHQSSEDESDHAFLVSRLAISHVRRGFWFYGQRCERASP